MKQTLALLVFLTAITPKISAQNNPDACLGVWLTGSQKGHIQVFKQDGRYFGKIVWLKDPNDPKTGKPPVDSKNPDVGKHTNPILGLTNLRDLKPDGENTWDGGKIYDPENGKEYSCKMKLINANRLDVRGYVGISLMGRTETWKRVK